MPAKLWLPPDGNWRLTRHGLTADVVFRTIGVERDFRPFQHHQQFGLVGVQPREQAVQRHEAGAAEENTVEAGP